MFSPKIVRAISETFLRSNWRFDTIESANLKGRADEDWIATFARSGGNALISGDRAMLKREALVSQISATGLVGIYLPQKWANSRGPEQMAYCIYWWAKIEKQIAAATPGTVWLAPNGMANGELRQYVNKNEVKRAKQEANRKV